MREVSWLARERSKLGIQTSPGPEWALPPLGRFPGGPEHTRRAWEPVLPPQVSLLTSVMALATLPDPRPLPALQGSPVCSHVHLHLEALRYFPVIQSFSKAACQVQTKIRLSVGPRLFPSLCFVPVISQLSPIGKPSFSLCPPFLSHLPQHILSTCCVFAEQCCSDCALGSPKSCGLILQ